MLASVIHEPVVRVNPDGIIIHPEGVRIDSFVKLEGGRGLTIGKYVHISSFAHIGIGGGETILEDYATVASGGKIISGTNVPDGTWTCSSQAPASMQKIERKRTILRRFACVFTNGVVCPGVTLHEGAVLGAGSVAMCDIPAWEIWGGWPARKLRDRKRP
jgi:galactoside O-acetyltransferase